MTFCPPQNISKNWLFFFLNRALESFHTMHGFTTKAEASTHTVRGKLTPIDSWLKKNKIGKPNNLKIGFVMETAY